MANLLERNLKSKIMFRVDGGPDIGLGHIMRCLSIADSSSIVGYQCVFVTADNTFESMITSHGHENIVLHSDYKNTSIELNFIFKIIKNIIPFVLFVDSYFVSYTYLSVLKRICEKIGCKLVYIDDIVAFPYPCDILLNYNIYGTVMEKEYRQMYQTVKKEIPKLLLGTAYVPLRDEFRKLPGKKVRECATDVLISTGGADLGHVSKNIATYIVMNNKNLINLHFHFIIGAMNPDKEDIEQITRSIKNVTLYQNIKSISKLMQKCDLAISAAGSTLYELCATQTPTVTYILADNQLLGAKGFVDRNILYCIGDARRLGNDLPKKLIDAAIDLSQKYEERIRIVQLQQKMIDGKGTDRIIGELNS